jgi:hypothetical protein
MAAKNLRQLSERAEKGEGLLGTLLAEKEDLPLIESLHRSAARLEETLKKVQEGDGLLHALIYEEGGKSLMTDTRRAVEVGEETLQDLRVVAADLKRITGALAEGEGTLGAFSSRTRPSMRTSRVSSEGRSETGSSGASSAPAFARGGIRRHKSRSDCKTIPPVVDRPQADQARTSLPFLLR